MNLYKKYLKLHLKSALQYKASFILSFISQFFIFFSFYFVVVSLFSKFGSIKGFTVYEVLLTFSVVQFGFSFNEVFGRGLDHLDILVKTGRLDQILVRPRGILFQIIGSDVDYGKIARLLQSIVIFVIALVNLKIQFTFIKIITIVLMLMSSILIFFGILLLVSSYCFYSIEGLEFRNVLTYEGRELAQYPISIYKRDFALFFTFIIPFAFINYYPLLYLLGRINNPLYAFSPLLIAIFLIPCFLVFKIASKRYLSTGS